MQEQYNGLMSDTTKLASLTRLTSLSYTAKLGGMGAGGEDGAGGEPWAPSPAYWEAMPRLLELKGSTCAHQHTWERYMCI